MTVLIPEAADAAAAAAGRAGGRKAAGKAASQRAVDYGAGQARQAGRDAGRARIVPGGRNYQGIILAEFLIAILVVAFLPLAAPPKDGKPGPSPYRVNDIKQLAAIGAVYFVLALFSSGERSGRVVAWFGAAVLGGIMFRKLAGGQVGAAAGQEQPPEPGISQQGH